MVPRHHRLQKSTLAYETVGAIGAAVLRMLQFAIAPTTR